jgi:four helix bundle protein
LAKSVDFIDEVYRISARFPADERYGLTRQIRQAAVSVAGNIAEGTGRFASRDLLNFLSQRRGSIKEAESHLLVAGRLTFVTDLASARALGLADEISRMLFQLRASVRGRDRRAGS